MESQENADNMPYEFEFSHEDVVIDPYSCDLNLIVDKECLLAYPISTEGFCSMWAGCRATYGVNSGKVAFEVHLEDYCECPDLPKDDMEPNLIRVGWSLATSTLQLGESEFSYAYCSNGKRCCNRTFVDYGDTFEKGDSIGSYLDFESDPDNIIISFSKNGIDQGIAFTVGKNELASYVDRNDEGVKKTTTFFPHVLSKNVVFEMNFGQRVSLIGDEPFAPIKSGFELIQKLPLNVRVCSEPASTDKSNYEILYVIGLPGAGKTHWIEEYIRKNRQKNYYVIGAANILKKMQMLGQRKKPNANQTGELTLINSLCSFSASKLQPDLLDKILKCINVMLDVACHSFRNIILDQANVYESTRRRKKAHFDGFRKRAVVIVPSDEIYKERLMSSQREDNKEIPPLLVNNMKIGFKLPKPDEFDSIEYVELNEQEAGKLVELYNTQGATERLDQLLSRRTKKNEEIRKNLNLNPTMFMRPIFRHSFYPTSQQTSNMGNRFPRYGAPNSGAYNVRRPVNQNYQMTRPNLRYPVPVGPGGPVDMVGPYGNQNPYMYGGTYATVMSNIPGQATPISPAGSYMIGQWPGASAAPAVYDYNQPVVHSHPANWNPNMALSYQATHPPSSVIYGMVPNMHQHHHHQAPYATGMVVPPAVHTSPANAAAWHHPQQNNWDPVMSTNVSQSISASAYSTNLTNINSNANSNDKT